MKTGVKLFFAATVIFFTGCAAMPKNESRAVCELPPITLPAGLESRRQEFEKDFANGQARIREFAEKNGWSKDWQCFVDSVEIFDKKENFDAAALKAAGDAPDTILPKTYSAVLERRILLAVSPSLFEQNYPNGVEPDYYEKIIAHEIAHRLHIAVLKGNEDDMGPVWFFEGFAIYASGQFENSGLNLTRDEIWGIINSEKRGDYRKYAVAFKYVLSKVPLKELVANANRSDFTAWLSGRVP